MRINGYWSKALSYLSTPSRLLDNITWRFPKTISDLNIVFVVGAPRSGTTLMQKILESHSSYTSIDSETGMFSKQNIFDKNRHHFGFSEKKIEILFRQSKDIVDFFTRCVHELDDVKCGRIFIEKTPQHAMHLSFILKFFPNAKVVHIVRDGRDCYSSAKKHSEIPQNSSPKRYARYWKSCVAGPMSSDCFARVYNVKYEDLVVDPKGVITQTMEFLGEGFEVSQVDPKVFGKDKRANMKEFEKLNKDINDNSVGRWKYDLDQVEIKEFEKIAYDELRYYGYPL